MSKKFLKLKDLSHLGKSVKCGLDLTYWCALLTMFTRYVKVFFIFLAGDFCQFVFSILQRSTVQELQSCKLVRSSYFLVDCFSMKVTHIFVAAREFVYEESSSLGRRGLRKLHDQRLVRKHILS